VERHLLRNRIPCVPLRYCLRPHNETAQRVKAAIAEWNEFKTTKLSRLNQKLSEANLAPIAISEIEQEVQFLMSR